jgi:hypothetical protein
MKRDQKIVALKGALALAAALALTTTSALASTTPVVDLTTSDSGNVTGDVGGTAIFANTVVHTSGTGVFDPFLTLERNASGGNNTYWEQAYNTDGHTALYMDEQRPEWNTRLTLGSLAQVNVGGSLYYAFILDANEPGANKSLISIDNIRVYTSSSDNTGSVKNNINNLDNLGTLRWAMNDPAVANGNLNGAQWVKLDANQNNIGLNANGGSGYADMVVYIPVSAFGNASASDFVWFYNLNGLEYAADPDLGAQAGYEEWKAVENIVSVPDGGTTLAMIGIAITGLGVLRRKLS